MRTDRYGLGSYASGNLWVPNDSLDKIEVSWPVMDMGPMGKGRWLYLKPVHNAFVNQGLQRALDLLYEALQGALSGISHIGLASDTGAVTSATSSLGTTTSIKPITNVSRGGQTVHGDANWTEADVTFTISRVGLLYGSNAADVVNIIGGTGGAAPYNRELTINLTNALTWSLDMGIDLTAAAT